MTGNTFYFEWEVRLMEWLQGIFNNSFGIAFFSFLSEFGEELICILILGVFYWGISKEMGKYIGINVCTHLVWNPMIKNLFVRRRPYFDNKTIELLKPIDAEADIYNIEAQGFSFPSGHSSCAATTYGSIFRLSKNKAIKAVCIAIILLVGISRFVLGAHYPTDVLCGFALGILIICLIPFLRKKIEKDWIFYGILLLIGLPGFFYCSSNDFYTGYGTMAGAFLGFSFDKRFVNFENTKSITKCVVRALAGGGLYMLLNTLLKLPFDKEFLATATLASHLVRTVRYIVVMFLICGVYPMVFKPVDRFFAKRRQAE